MTFSRKGISPLIATVLLLAFAVAIGTMAVSYVLDATKESACTQVEISLESSQHICLSTNKATFILANKGQQPIVDLVVRFVTADQELDERSVPVTIDAGRATQVNLEYTKPSGTGTTVTIVPAIKEGGDVRFCAERELVTTIAPC